MIILVTVLTVGCSQDDNENRDNNNFTIPELLIGNYQKQNSNLFLDVEKHRVTFNTLEGETIVVTNATQMAQDMSYTTLAFDDKIILITLIGEGVSLEYLYNGGDRIFLNYYGRE